MTHRAFIFCTIAVLLGGVIIALWSKAPDEPQVPVVAKVFMPEFSGAWEQNEDTTTIDNLITPPVLSTRLLTVTMPQRSISGDDWARETEDYLKATRAAVVEHLKKAQVSVYGFQGYNLFVDTIPEQGQRHVTIMTSFLMTTIGDNKDQNLAQDLTVAGFPTQISPYIMGECEH